LYTSEYNRIIQIQDETLRQYELAKLNLDIEEKKLAIYKEQVKILTEGKATGGGEQTFLEGKNRLKNANLGSISNEWIGEELVTPLEMPSFAAVIQESINAIGQMSAGAFEMAAGDSELMGIINGSLDPLSAIIMGLIEMVMEIENVNKVLNPITTLLEGTKTTIERDFNTALQPIVNILMKLGEIIGEVLLIPIEELGWIIETTAAPLMLLLEFVKMIVAVLRPIIKLVFKLLNPFTALYDILNTFIGLSTSAIEMETARQAALQDLYDKELQSLQDLYNVGALSGAEYEAGLAALKSRYPTEEGGTQLSPREQAFADWLQGIWTGIDAISLWCENAYASWIAPIIEALDYIWAGVNTPELQAALDALGTAFGGLADSMSGVVLSLVQIIADTLVALAPLIIWMINTFLAGLIREIGYVQAAIEIFAGAFGVVAGVIDLLWGAIKWFCAWITGDSDAQLAAEIAIQNALIDILNGLIIMTNGLITAVNALYLGAVGALNALIKFFGGTPITVQGIPYIPLVPGAHVVGGGSQNPAGDSAPTGDGTGGGTGEKGIDTPNTGQAGSAAAGRVHSAATGSGYLPSDMLLQAHKGELIAPNPFAAEIRKGNLTLSGPRGSGSGGDVYQVNVYGSVITERELVSLVAEGIHKQKVKGYA